MATPRRTGRLFWKLLLVLWLSTVLSMAGVMGYLQLTGRKPPQSAVLLVGGLIPLLPLAASAVSMLLTSLGLAWYFSRPLQHLSWALHQVAEGRLDTRVQQRMGRRRDEIADLAGDFDRMARQLQALTESRKVLLHDISHELRSPLARMQAAIGLARQAPAQADAMLQRIERESQRLNALMEELITWHRLEAGAAEPPARVDVMELLQAIAEDAQFEARALGREFSMEVGMAAQGPFVANVHGELLYRAFENVIRNAIKFSPVGAEVQVCAQVSADDSELLCQVRDRGPGVPPTMLEAIFQPFTRVAGSQGVQGMGLGLAIAQRAFALHGGQIRASLREGGGLVMSLRLPRQSPVGRQV